MPPFVTRPQRDDQSRWRRAALPLLSAVSALQAEPSNRARAAPMAPANEVMFMGSRTRSPRPPVYPDGKFLSAQDDPPVGWPNCRRTK
jgi:hypothetical protein